MAWREELHPRHANGRFAPKGTLPSVSIKSTLGNLSAASEEDLLDVYHRLSSRKQLDRKALATIDAELERREGGPLPPADDTPEQRAVDDYVRRGWSYSDAYAEAYGKSAKQIRNEERATLVGRKAGETTEQATRRAYRELVALESLQAEEATRGHMLAHQCAKVAPASLWSAAPDRARRCASEELKRWWESQGGRTTYADFKARLGGGQRSRAGAGRDFGV